MVTVYIVDDDEAVRDSFSAYLEACGYETLAFETGEAFLAARELDGEACLLLDVNLPGMSGIELLERFAAGDTRIPTVVITGRGDERTKARAERAGAVAVFDKPVSNAMLLDTIRTVFGQPQA